MSSPMIQHQTSNQLRITGQFMHHVHDLNHMKVDWFICNSDNVDCIYNYID